LLVDLTNKHSASPQAFAAPSFTEPLCPSTVSTRRSRSPGRGFAYSGAMSTPTSRKPAIRRLAALAIAGAVLLGTTACSGIPTLSDDAPPTATSTPSAEESSGGDGESTGDDGQSTADACALVEDTITQATDDFENVSADDPQAVIDAMRTAAQRISDTSEQITNDEVAALLPSLQGMFEQVADVMSAIASGDVSRVAEVEELGADFQETSEQFQALCAP
jgi:hypothetical protein